MKYGAFCVTPAEKRRCASRRLFTKSSTPSRRVLLSNLRPSLAMRWCPTSHRFSPKPAINQQPAQSAQLSVSPSAASFPSLVFFSASPSSKPSRFDAAPNNAERALIATPHPRVLLKWRILKFSLLWRMRREHLLVADRLWLPLLFLLLFLISSSLPLSFLFWTSFSFSYSSCL